MHAGIDLGTTNSVVTLFDGTTVSVVPNNLGESLTPSVVRIDARGNTIVGRRAYRFLETDPANTRSEFKRLMGTEERIAFEAAGKSLLPEELSSLVLSSLLADAEGVLGARPTAAVISTPALFELPQNHATVRAGRLAGLERVELIQEPVASAIAAGWRAEGASGLWLVFDLGGGTLDVSLLETREGWLRVVDQWGDNFLGGKDFDNALAHWALERLRGGGGVASRRALARLKAACELAKIDLSRVERTAILCNELRLDPEREPVDVDLEITRADFLGLVRPLLYRCVQVCRSLLEKAKVAPDAVERVVFVGGPTLTPAVREHVGGLFGGRVAEGFDPMTLVARGAALFAATAGLEALPAKAAPASRGMAVRLEHPAVTMDTEPFVVGRFLPARGEDLPARVLAEREDGGFASSEAEVGPEGGFIFQVRLERQQQNRFRLAARTAKGGETPLRNAAFAIVHGVSVADPPLSRSVGVALSDDSVHLYFEKGTPLPARRTVVHQTAQTVAPGQDALLIPVVQGESGKAHRNRLIGTLRVHGRGLRRAIPSGTRIEVTLHLDRSGQLQARADLPSEGASFEDVVHVLVPSASVEVLERELGSAEARVLDLRRRAFRNGDPRVVQGLAGAEELLREAAAGLESAIGGDADAAQRVHRLLLDLNAGLDTVEESFRWPELEAEADDSIRTYLRWTSSLGTAAEQKLGEQTLQAILQARKQRNAPELERQLRALDALANAAFARSPEAPVLTFEWYQARLAQATDVPRARALLEKGRAALDRNDLEGLRAVNRQLDPLYGGSAEERGLSYGSGVQ